MNKYLIALFLILMIFILPIKSSASKQNIEAIRQSLYEKTASLTFVPWYYLAAWDTYERNINNDKDSLINLSFDETLWFGPANSLKSKDPHIINIFSGIGEDGNGDGIADPENPEDVLYTAARYLTSVQNNKKAYHIQLWDFYMRDLAVQTIKYNAKIYKKMQTSNLQTHAFPITDGYHYTYNNTWGHARGYGGNRIHEGTDIFAAYGTPVQSTSYGVVELKGWNQFGGWRIGIRDTDNTYHYYAHLNNYAEDIKVGDIVKPGEQIGTVGSSGYGPPGTAGKFPPHLHYGMYKDNGENEWAFDPYPSLKKWERESN